MQVRNWRKSSRSSNQGNCIEVGTATLVFVRDTKLGDASRTLAICQPGWQRFVENVKAL